MASILRTVLLAAAILIPGLALGADPDPSKWQAVLAQARGQTVYFNAWGGEPKVNDYIAWAAGEVEQRYGVKLVHVKLTDTAEAVSRTLAEKAAGRDEGGSVDLVWINGENFAAMKRAGLLFGPWSEALPNYRFVDVGQPTMRSDFSVPVDGFEAPWGTAQLVFIHDAAELPSPPRSIVALVDWASANPGRFTYPQPTNFLGATFLKQALYGVVADPELLQRPADQVDFEGLTAPLFTMLDSLHPLLWRAGRVFPQNSAALRTLLSDREISLAMSFDPAEAANAIASGELPPTVRAYTLEGGTIGNVNFLAIAYNSSAKAGAMVVANFLMSPEAQARKLDPRHWGGGTVLAMDRLDPADRARFENLPQSPALPKPQDLGPQLPELHPTWTDRLKDAWSKRYGAR